MQYTKIGGDKQSLCAPTVVLHCVWDLHLPTINKFQNGHHPLSGYGSVSLVCDLRIKMLFILNYEKVKCIFAISKYVNSVHRLVHWLLWDEFVKIVCGKFNHTWMFDALRTWILEKNTSQAKGIHSKSIFTSNNRGTWIWTTKLCQNLTLVYLTSIYVVQLQVSPSCNNCHLLYCTKSSVHVKGILEIKLLLNHFYWSQRVRQNIWVNIVSQPVGIWNL